MKRYQIGDPEPSLALHYAYSFATVLLEFAIWTLR